MRTINQNLINITFIIVAIIMIITPAALMVATWNIMGVASVIFLLAYWYVADVVRGYFTGK